MNLRAAVARLRLPIDLGAVLRWRSRNSDRASLSEPQTRLLRALLCGCTLKSHRDIDGGKDYRLHPLRGGAVPVSAQVVLSLQERGFLQSNQKFPAATLLLTERGHCAALSAQDAADASPTTGEFHATPR